jgi:hypothetical protein
MKSMSQKGDISELSVALQLKRLGYRVSRPLSQDSPYDLLADDGTRIFKIQVKSAHVAHKQGGYGVTMKTRENSRYSECDFIVAHVEPEDLYYIFPISEVLSRSDLRIFPSPRTETKYCRFRNAWDLLK